MLNEELRELHTYIVSWHNLGRLFIADTNNSVIRYLDLGKEEPVLLTLELKGVQVPASKSKSLRRLRRRSTADTETVKVNGVSSNEGKLCLKISVPEGYHFSKVLSFSICIFGFGPGVFLSEFLALSWDDSCALFFLHRLVTVSSIICRKHAVNSV